MPFHIRPSIHKTVIEHKAGDIFEVTEPLQVVIYNNWNNWAFDDFKFLEAGDRFIVYEPVNLHSPYRAAILLWGTQYWVEREWLSKHYVLKL